MSSTVSRALLYGESVFTTLRVEQGRACFRGAHEERLRRSAEWLWPGANFTFPAVPQGSGVWRIMLSADGERGEWRAPEKPNLRLEATWSEGLPATPTLTLGRPAAWPAFLKTPDYLERLVAARHLEAHPLFHVGGHLTELLHHNVFFLIDGVLVTPPEGPDVLAGIGRLRTLTLASAHGWRAEIRPVAVNELARVQAAFAVNAVRGVCPVERIDGRATPSHPWMATLAQEFFSHDRPSSEVPPLP